MSLRRFPPTNLNDDADRYTPTHNLPGRDSELERPSGYSFTDSDALGVAGTSQRSTLKHSKRPSGNKLLLIYMNYDSILSNLC